MAIYNNGTSQALVPYSEIDFLTQQFRNLSIQQVIPEKRPFFVCEYKDKDVWIGREFSLNGTLFKKHSSWFREVFSEKWIDSTSVVEEVIDGALSPKVLNLIGTINVFLEQGILGPEEEDLMPGFSQSDLENLCALSSYLGIDWVRAKAEKELIDRLGNRVVDEKELNRLLQFSDEHNLNTLATSLLVNLVCSFTREDLKVLASEDGLLYAYRHLITALSSDQVARFKTSGDLAEFIACCSNLESIDLSKTNHNLEGISFPVSLKKLKLCGCVWITSDFLNKTMKTLEIEELDLSGTSCRIGDVTFSLSLKKLGLRGMRVGSNGSLKKALERCPKLEELDLTNTDYSLEDDVLPASLKKLWLENNKVVTNLKWALAKCSQLEYLNLNETNCGVAGISVLASLKELWLRKNQAVTNSSLKTILEKCTQLTLLLLSGTKCSLEGVEVQASLKELWLSESAVTNVTLKKALKNNPQLIELDIMDTSCSLEGVILPASLKILWTTGNKSVTDKFLKDACVLCPGCLII